MLLLSMNKNLFSNYREYKLWRQKDYSFMYSIKDPQIKEIRVGFIFYWDLIDRKGLLLISKTLQSIANSSILVMPIMTVDIQTREIIYRANFFLHSKKEIEFLEVFEEYIFIKQQDHRLVVFSVCISFCIFNRWWRMKLFHSITTTHLIPNLLSF